jgi:general secretion pathway protein I
MKRGFTLLEVMISLAILAVALVALSDLNGGAVQMQAYARRATQATLLLRGKMADVEEQLQKDGFSDFSDDKHGSFDDEEGAQGYEWRAEILKPDVTMDAAQLLQLLGAGAQGAAGGASGSQGGTAPAQGGVGSLTAPGSPVAGLLAGQATTFLETLKKSVREVRVTVSWKDGSQERNITASQHIVILPEMVGTAGQTPAPTTTSTTPGVPGIPGTPGVPGVPGIPGVTR